MNVVGNLVIPVMTQVDMIGTLLYFSSLYIFGKNTRFKMVPMNKGLDTANKPCCAVSFSNSPLENTPVLNDLFILLPLNLIDGKDHEEHQ